jgi:3-oxoacyl-(acyl-carrier-protein) synthase
MIAIETGAIGHNMCVVSACATGTHSVAEGAEAIRRGDCIAVISGSTEAPLLEVAHAGFGNMRGLGSPRPGEPLATVSRPFDKTRDGFVLGEGSASLFLEDLEIAKARGAKIYAEVVGYGSAADGWDMIQPVEGGAGSARAMQMSLDRRGVPADEVDLINPHGTSTPLGDRREAEAIWHVFGDRALDLAVEVVRVDEDVGVDEGDVPRWVVHRWWRSSRFQCRPPRAAVRPRAASARRWASRPRNHEEDTAGMRSIP